MTIDPSHIAEARLRGHRSQQVFDTLLRTLAEPGTIRTLPPELSASVPPVAWPALALADVDVSVAVAGSNRAGADALASLLRAATDCPLTDTPSAAMVVMPEPEAATLADVSVGTPLAPEDGARVSIAVDGFDREGSTEVTLSGPGVDGRRRVRIGLDRLILDRLGDAAGRFPCGFDTWLVADDGRVMAIPRSTTVETVEADSADDSDTETSEETTTWAM
jgi:alpha-D-ribose 1-methylphosphonate 5-triphosphate synthase subunit PhnH